MRLAALREQLVALHAELPRHGLVVWTGGNVSARDPDSGLVAIKPSSDLASHLYVYRHRPDVHGVVHTHSRYATAFAAAGLPIPCVTTGQADEFGGEIPCAGLALVGDDGIGRLIVETIGRSPAVLLRNHGVFTVGPTAEAAVKAAVMTEDVAATTFLALQLGTPEPIPADLVDRFHERYTKVYGQ